MKTPRPDETLQARRQELEGELQRALRANRGVLALAALLALAAIGLAYDSYLKAGRIAGHSQQLEDQRHRVEEALWQSHLAHAHAALESNRPGARQTALEAVAEAARWRASPELRDLAIAALCRTDIGDESHFSPIASHASGPDQSSPFLYAIDPTAQFAVFATTNATLGCLELANGRTVWEIPIPAPPLDGPVIWSPDGKSLAFQDRGHFRIQNIQERTFLVEWPRLKKPGPHLPACFSKDGKTFFGWMDGQGVLFDLVTGRETARFGRFERVDHAAFHPSLPWLAIGTGNRVELWDWRARERIQTLALGRPGAFSHLDWAPDGGALAGSGDDGGIYIWDAATLLEPQQRWHVMEGHTLPAWNVAFTRSGDFLVSCAWGTETRLWNYHRQSGEFLLSLSHGYGVRFGPGDQTLAMVRPNQGIGIRPVAISDTMRRLAGPIGSSQFIRGLTFSADERWIAGVSHDGLFIWNAASNRIVARRPVTGAFAVLFRSRGNEWLIGSESGIMRQPWIGGTNGMGSPDFHLGEPSYLPLPGGFNHVFKLAMSRDESRVAAGDRRGQGYVFDLGGHQPPVVLRGQNSLDTLAFSPDGSRLASGTWQGAGTWIWNTSDGLPVHKIDSVDADVAYTPDGQWLVISRVGEHAFWHTGSNRVVKTLPREAGEQTIGRVAVFPDGRTIAINESFLRAQIVDVPTLKVLANIVPPGERKIEGVRVSPSGRWLAVMTTHIYLYDLSTLRRQLAQLGLDWGSEPNTRPNREGSLTSPGFALVGAPLPISTSPHGYLAALVLSGLCITLFLGGMAQRYQRRLLRNYFELEAISARRHEQLLTTQSELQHSQKMKALGTLAAGIAHDFNNLLSVIRMANQLTAERAPADSDLRENTSLIELSVAQGKAVVRSMLGYSRAPVERAAFQPGTVIRETALLLNQQFLRGIHLTLDVDSPVPRVVGVRSRLEQILLNLILNSAEAMAGQGELRLAVLVADSLPEAMVLKPRPSRVWVETRVADSGPGISQETLQRIFDPFFTTKLTGTTHGTGLGLSMVHAIAEGEGFGLALESSPGQGTCFRIFLPLE